MSFGQEIDGEVGPERVAHVGQEKIGSIERATRARQPRLALLGRNHYSARGSSATASVNCCAV